MKNVSLSSDFWRSETGPAGPSEIRLIVEEAGIGGINEDMDVSSIGENGNKPGELGTDTMADNVLWTRRVDCCLSAGRKIRTGYFLNQRTQTVLRGNNK